MKFRSVASVAALVALFVHPSIRTVPTAQVPIPLMLTANASDELTAIGDTLYFAGHTPDTGHELWKSDGTVAGTVMIKDIHDNDNECMKDSLPQNFVSLGGGVVLFTAVTGDEPCELSYGEGEELWRSDGTEAGTWMVKDINPGVEGSFNVNGNDDLVHLNGLVVFAANDGAHGRELWASDGTAAGTNMLRDIRPGASDGDPGPLTEYNGRLYFYANDGTNGYELWTTDGTAAGTMLVHDINPTGGSNPTNLFVAGGWLYFSATDGVTGQELWRTDGTSVHTHLVMDLRDGNQVSPGVQPMADIGGEIVFAAVYTVGGVDHGDELFISDGTEAGTRILRDIRPGTPRSQPQSLGMLGDIFLFSANDGTAGKELWRTDGTEAGTFMVSDLTPVSGTDFSYPRVLGAWLYFVAHDATAGRELWRSDGTAAGTQVFVDLAPGIESGQPALATLIGDTLFFRTDLFAGSLPYRSLWALGVGDGGPDPETPVIMPVVSGTVGDNDWYTSDVSISWNIDDNGSPISSSSGCDSASVSSDTTGLTFTCSATNAGGTASSSVTIKRDTTPPTATPSTTPSVNASGWYRTDVVVSWTGADATSGIAWCTLAETLSAEGMSQSSGLGSCTDTAGLESAATQLVGINIDKTAPVTTVTPSSSNNQSGWYNTDVTATWSGIDALSGIAFCTAPETVSAEGAGQATQFGTCTDLAGNVSVGVQIFNINIDKTAPTIAAVVPGHLSRFPRRSRVTVDYSCSDTVSGIASDGCVGTLPDGALLDTSKRVKKGEFVITATDLAGNTHTITIRYEITPKED